MQADIEGEERGKGAWWTGVVSEGFFEVVDVHVAKVGSKYSTWPRCWREGEEAEVERYVVIVGPRKTVEGSEWVREVLDAYTLVWTDL